MTTWAQKMERNPALRMGGKMRKFLYRYVQGEEPYRLAEELWPEARDIQGKVRTIMSSEIFQNALKHLAEYEMTPATLAYRLLRIAKDARRDSDKVAAIKTASVILGMGISQRSLPVKKALKTQKLNLKKLGQGELEAKLERLAKQIAGDTSGHQKQPS